MIAAKEKGFSHNEEIAVSGHGHIYDSSRTARCGGPALCGICQTELRAAAVVLTGRREAQRTQMRLISFNGVIRNGIGGNPLDAWRCVLNSDACGEIVVYVPFPRSRINAIA